MNSGYVVLVRVPWLPYKVIQGAGPTPAPLYTQGSQSLSSRTLHQPSMLLYLSKGA